MRPTELSGSTTSRHTSHLVAPPNLAAAGRLQLPATRASERGAMWAADVDYAISAERDALWLERTRVDLKGY